MKRIALRDAAALVAVVRERARKVTHPCVVALDGRSGSGKSTLAAKLAEAMGALVIDGDDFFAGGVDVRRDEAHERARDCIDWRRQRPVLDALRSGRPSSYCAFDWEAFDGRLEVEPTHVESRPVVILEGVYSARPELVDLVDLRVLLRVSDQTRVSRLLAREGGIGAWEKQWHEAEEWYFAHAAVPSAFDVIVDA
jgi:uridine kinase